MIVQIGADQIKLRGFDDDLNGSGDAELGFILVEHGEAAEEGGGEAAGVGAIVREEEEVVEEEDGVHLGEGAFEIRV